MITMEVSKAWFEQMRKTIPHDKGATDGARVEEECAKKTFLLYIQSWLARGDVEKWHEPRGNRRK